MSRPPVSARVRGNVARLRKLLWEAEDPGLFGAAFRVVAVSIWKFASDRGFLRASALTYATLLSLVPLLAIMFSVLKGLGVQRRLEPLLLQHIAAGNQEVVNRILGYVDRTDFGQLGAVGLVALLFTAVSVLSNVERSFNDIWQIRSGRAFLRKVADYIALLVLGPLLLLVSLSLTTTFQSDAIQDRLALLGPVAPMLLRLLPLAAVWIAFTALYVIMPNRRVPLGAAVLGGVVAGSVWHVAEWAYVGFQFGVSRYNAIYGAMAQLPILLVWLYVSWCIVLLGAELAFVFQLPGKGRFLRSEAGLWVPRLDAALALLLAVARRFERGEPPVGESKLIDELDLHPAEGSRIVSRLVEVGLLTPDQGDPPGFLPARSPDRVSAGELLDAVAGLSHMEEGTPEVLAERVRGLLEHDLAGVTWAELAMDGEEGGG